MIFTFFLKNHLFKNNGIKYFLIFLITALSFEIICLGITSIFMKIQTD